MGAVTTRTLAWMLLARLLLGMASPEKTVNLTIPPSRVLIGQPDASMRSHLESFFRGVGCEPLVVRASEEALHIARSGGFRLGVIDEEFPKLGGLEVVRFLARLVNRIPCILTARLTSKEAQMAALDAGVVTVLEKPFTDDTLQFAVTRVFGLSRPGSGDRENRTH